MLELAIKARLGDVTLDATFDAPRGVTALFGPSGAGKTSVINAVAGLLKPDAGRIILNGTVLFDAQAGVDVPPHRRQIGYVFQDARLFPHMSVARNLAYGGQHNANAVTRMLGLEALLDRRPAGLSGGEKQRVALGRALMCDPQVLLMDEPLAALDAARKSEIMPYLERVRDAGDVPIIYVSHAMEEVTRLATTLVLMDGGRVTQSGALADVLVDPEAALGRENAGALIDGTVTAFDATGGTTAVAYSGGTLHVPGRAGDVGAAIRLRIPPQDVILATALPGEMSAINVLPVTITRLTFGDHGRVMVSLMAGSDRLVAAITAASVQRLGLATGQQVFAIVKATAMVAPT